MDAITTDGGARGSRIRARRLSLGLKQSAVARDCGISPSYLVLIEKGRRQIGGALLMRIAAVLDVPPARLTDGAPAGLLAELRAVPGAAALVEEEPAEALAERHPGWAGLLAAQAARIRALERRLAEASDRLAHDPRLAEAVHELISAVAAIRSSASILAEGALDENWRRRFLRNIREDAGRLAGGAEALTAWLERDGGGPASSDADPVAAASAWLARLPAEALASGVGGGGGEGEGAPGGLAGGIARAALDRFARDAELLPVGALSAAMEAAGGDPIAAAARLDLPEILVLRRLGVLGRGDGAGLILSDASGVPTLALVPDGFPLPRAGAACPNWPLHQVGGDGAAAAVCAVHGAEGQRWSCVAAARAARPGGLGAAPVVRSAMLVRPALSEPAERGIGPGCPLCPAERCAARREPFALSGEEERSADPKAPADL